MGINPNEDPELALAAEAATVRDATTAATTTASADDNRNAVQAAQAKPAGSREAGASGGGVGERAGAIAAAEHKAWSLEGTMEGAGAGLTVASSLSIVSLRLARGRGRKVSSRRDTCCSARSSTRAVLRPIRRRVMKSA